MEWLRLVCVGEGDRDRVLHVDEADEDDEEGEDEDEQTDEASGEADADAVSSGMASRCSGSLLPADGS